MNPEVKNSERIELVNIIHDYIDRNKGIDPKFTWGRLYKILGNEYRINIFAGAKRKGIKPLDYIEQENLMGRACIIAQVIFSGDAK